VSTVQLRALTVLRSAAGVNLGRLAQEMAVTVSTASRLVDRLIAAGLVDRRPSKATRREISVTLTPHGHEVLRRYDDLRVDALVDRLDELGSSERTATVDALSNLSGTREPVTAGA
jgi:DNA-binding MarR family transcriptional regulator